ncbi:MAG: hypothetical protein KIT00_09605 [Rhodospirillales bacterium]|nr:hypothetical protein [Rhodospirillales bacterium]
MKLAATIVGSLKADLQAEVRQIEKAIAAGVKEAGDGLKGELRRQVVTAGLGQRLARTWRSRAYPNQGHDAASLVWSKAPQIVRAFDEGAVIRSRKGFWLAIPTPEAPKRGSTGKRITPGMVERMYGRRLRFVYRPRGPSLLVMDGMVARGGKRGGFRLASTRKASRSRGAYVSTSGLTTVVMFLLVPQVRMPKRLDVARAAERWSARLPALILRRARRA